MKDSLDISKSGDCASKSLVYNYNRYMGLMLYYDPISNLFCVALDNSNQMGTFYNSPNQTSIQFLSYTQQQANKMLIYYYRYILNAASTPYIESTVYKIGDPIRVNNNTALNTNLDSLFLVYTMGAYGECSKTGSVRFLVDNPQFSCGLNIVSRLNLSKTQLSQCVSYGYEQIISKRISSSPLPSSAWVPILISSVYVKDMTLNTLTNSSTKIPSTTLSQNGAQCSCNNLAIEVRILHKFRLIIPSL